MGIHVSHLSKRFNNVQALNNISLHIQEGVYGLLGDNGAGKSTFMNILATLLPFNEGDVRIFDYDLKSQADGVRSLLGYLPQSFHFFSEVNVLEGMEYIATLKGISRPLRRKETMKWIELVGLQEQMNKKIKHLSGGMKQRFGIAQAMLGEPRVIIVDEPTVGLDPGERIAFRHLLHSFSKGRIVLLSTHIVPDIASTCSQLAILNKGKVIFNGDVENLLDHSRGYVWSAQIELNELDQLIKNTHVISVVRKKDLVDLRYLSLQPIDVFPDAVQVEPTLEDAYVFKNTLSNSL